MRHVAKILTLVTLSCAIATAMIPENSTQAIVATADSWDSSDTRIVLYEKKGETWRQTGLPIAARLGKNGLAWGWGITEPPKGQKGKREGDLRTPAGIFTLGGVYGTVSTPKKHPSLPYHKVTAKDLWVEDPSSPQYNHHLVLKRPARTQWELQQQMKLNDYPHSLKLFIRHNAPGDPGRPIAQAGSSIFFHIWRRDGAAATAGCTTMSEADLRRIIAWLEPSRNPVYIILPIREYRKHKKQWNLP